MRASPPVTTDDRPRTPPAPAGEFDLVGLLLRADRRLLRHWLLLMSAWKRRRRDDLDAAVPLGRTSCRGLGRAQIWRRESFRFCLVDLAEVRECSLQLGQRHPVRRQRCVDAIDQIAVREGRERVAVLWVQLPASEQFEATITISEPLEIAGKAPSRLSPDPRWNDA